MKWRMERLGAVMVLSLLCPLGTACDSDKSDGYEFAVIGPFSGDTAVYGDDLRKGVDLAVGQINKAGGIKGHKVTTQYLDTQCDATQAANVASKVASDSKVFAVIGDVCSSATLAAIPILSRAGIAMMSPDSTSPKITQIVKDKHYTNFARNIPTDAQMARSMVRLAGALHRSRVGVLYASDDFGQPVFQFQKPEVGSAGATLADSETYTPTKTKDFTPQLSKLASSGVDTLLIDGYYSDAGPAVSQMARAGMKDVTVIGSAGIDQGDYMKLGGKATEGTYVFSYYNADNPNPANTKFAQAFRAKYGANTDAATFAYAVWGYEIPFIYQKAIEAGATRSTMAAKVRGVTFDGPTGPTSFDANGDVRGKSGVVLKVVDGRFEFQADLTAAVNG